MSKYHIRFNKSRGQSGRGTLDHVWRVFEDGHKEYLVKHFKINVPCFSETTGDGNGHDDWNVSCEGQLTLDRITSTAIIDPN